MPRTHISPWDEGPLAQRRIQKIDPHSLTVIEKKHIQKLMTVDGILAKDLSEYYGPTCSYFRSLAFKKRHYKMINANKGQPPILAEEDKPEVEAFLKKKKKKLAATEEEFKKHLQGLHDKRCRAAGRAPKKKVISKSFMRKLRKDFIKKGKGQSKTPARDAAMSDPRNMYAEYIALACLQEGIDPNLIINFDATQYFISDDGVIRKLIWLKTDSDTPASYLSDGCLGLFLKAYLVGAASGIVAPMVLNIAMEDMDADDFKVIKVQGMSHVPAPGQYGYLAFTKTRGCNDKFYQWFYSNVILPFVHQQREDLQLGTIENGKWTNDSMKALVSSDGEQIQIRNIFTNEILKEFEDELAAALKHASSISEATNAWDACNYFKASKKRTKTQIDEALKKGKHAIGRIMDQELFKLFPSLEKAKRDKVCDAVVTVIVAAQKTLNLDSVTTGFKKTGQYPLDFQVKMGTCKTDITSDHYDNMFNNIGHFVDIFKREGRITEAEFDEKNIIRFDDDRAKSGKEKDQRVLHQQRTVQLNNKETIVRFNSYQTRAELAAIPRTELQQVKADQKKALADAKLAAVALAKKQKLDIAELKKKTIEANRAARNMKASNKAIKAKQPTITKVTKVAKKTLANKATNKTPVEIVSSKGRKIKVSNK